jgi:hypothetical protein
MSMLQCICVYAVVYMYVCCRVNVCMLSCVCCGVYVYAIAYMYVCCHVYVCMYVCCHVCVMLRICMCVVAYKYVIAWAVTLLGSLHDATVFPSGYLAALFCRPFSLRRYAA